MTAAQLLLTVSDGLGIEVPEALPAAMDLVEAELEANASSVVALVEQVASSTLRAGGKRIRPALAIVSGLACDPETDTARLAKLAASLEMVHMATLVHDDVIDGSATRRGAPTAKSLFGVEAAVLSGDVLLAKAMRTLALDGDVEVIRMVSEAVVALAEGETLEIEVRGRFDLTVDELNQVVEMKTASLLRACCQVGAHVARADPVRFRALSSFGGRIGRAFQAVDDILDYVGDPERTGKAVGQDFREGQATLPLLLFRERADSNLLCWAESRFGHSPIDEDTAILVNHMDELGCFDEAWRQANAELELALADLDHLPAGPCREILATLADALVRREG